MHMCYRLVNAKHPPRAHARSRNAANKEQSVENPNAKAAADLPYFGYGTLLGLTQMRQNYPSAEILGLAFYDQHELGFWRYADASEGGCTMVYNPDSILFGVLYRLSQEDMAKLLAVGGAWPNRMRHASST